MPKSPEQLARKRALKAEKARRRRALRGAVPRTESRAAQLRDLGVSPDAFYALRRRARLRDGVACPTADPECDSFSYPHDAVSYPSAPIAEPIKLHSDLWGGWLPVPSIRTAPIADLSPGQGQDVSRADALIASCRNLPGGSDPMFQAALRRLVAAAEALEPTA